MQTTKSNQAGARTQNKKPTKAVAKEVLRLLSFGLVKGLGKPEPGKMCVEAAVCFAMGLPHSDEPSCVSSVVRSFKIALNDCEWSSDMARANGLRRLAIAQLGSEQIDETIFAKELALSTVRKIVPLALSAAAKVNPNHADRLKEVSDACANSENLAAASAASYAASYAARAASDAASAASYAARAASYASYAARAASDASRAARAASYAASDAASDASYAASDASYAASDAASDAARAARAASYASYAARAASDESLSLVAECAVEALRKCKSPGCKWLSLCE